jgi:hypothetical protein
LAPRDKSGSILALAGIEVNMRVMLIVILPRNEQILIAMLKKYGGSYRALERMLRRAIFDRERAYVVLK